MVLVITVLTRHTTTYNAFLVGQDIAPTVSLTFIEPSNVEAEDNGQF